MLGVAGDTELYRYRKGLPTPANELEIEVVNLWPNRLIGDARLPKEKRLTVTNVKKFDKPNAPLLPSGLLGPVTVQAAPAGLEQ